MVSDRALFGSSPSTHPSIRNVSRRGAEHAEVRSVRMHCRSSIRALRTARIAGSKTAPSFGIHVSSVPHPWLTIPRLDPNLRVSAPLRDKFRFRISNPAGMFHAEAQRTQRSDQSECIARTQSVPSTYDGRLVQDRARLRNPFPLRAPSVVNHSAARSEPLRLRASA
jgi:hypothetical protein